MGCINAEFQDEAGNTGSFGSQFSREIWLVWVARCSGQQMPYRPVIVRHFLGETGGQGGEGIPRDAAPSLREYRPMRLWLCR